MRREVEELGLLDGKPERITPGRASLGVDKMASKKMFGFMLLVPVKPRVDRVGALCVMIWVGVGLKVIESGFMEVEAMNSGIGVCGLLVDCVILVVVVAASLLLLLIKLLLKFKVDLDGEGEKLVLAFDSWIPKPVLLKSLFPPRFDVIGRPIPSVIKSVFDEVELESVRVNLPLPVPTVVCKESIPGFL